MPASQTLVHVRLVAVTAASTALVVVVVVEVVAAAAVVVWQPPPPPKPHEVQQVQHRQQLQRQVVFDLWYGGFISRFPSATTNEVAFQQQIKTDHVLVKSIQLNFDISKKQNENDEINQIFRNIFKQLHQIIRSETSYVGCYSFKMIKLHI